MKVLLIADLVVSVPTSLLLMLMDRESMGEASPDIGSKFGGAWWFCVWTLRLWDWTWNVFRCKWYSSLFLDRLRWKETEVVRWMICAPQATHHSPLPFGTMSRLQPASSDFRMATAKPSYNNWTSAYASSRSNWSVL